ncbi:MAG: sulfatase-like hydrolase/transferase, partial [Deltaproteobacteria bacterium]|nr:sulfatase-like hydrolase/transferase [Deltaproteobacteria bacterium]
YAYASQGYTYSSVKQFLFGGFDDNGSTVMDDFKLSGYETTVFTGYNLKEEPFGKYLTGDYIFDTRKDMKRESHQHTTPSRRVVKAFDNFLNNRDNSKPFFSFFFLTDPHFPYKQVNTPVLCDKYIATRDIKPKNRELVERSYYDQVWHVDKAAGGIMDSLEAHNIKNNTTIIFIGDHGESLYDDGITIGHGLEINDVMTHTAMVVVNPLIDFPDVLSHMHLRKLLHNVISADKTLEHVAKLLPLTDRKLFQYTGSLRYPREIGLFSVDDGRVVYKIQEDELTASKIEDGDTEDITSLRNNKYEKQIINKWEYTLFKDSKYDSMVPAKNL